MCTKFSKLILRKIIKIVAKRRKILSPDAAGGAYSAPPYPLAGFKGPYF